MGGRHVGTGLAGLHKMETYTVGQHARLREDRRRDAVACVRRRRHVADDGHVCVRLGPKPGAAPAQPEVPRSKAALANGVLELRWRRRCRPCWKVELVAIRWHGYLYACKCRGLCQEMRWTNIKNTGLHLLLTICWLC